MPESKHFFGGEVLHNNEHCKPTQGKVTRVIFGLYLERMTMHMKLMDPHSEIDSNAFGKIFMNLR